MPTEITLLLLAFQGSPGLSGLNQNLNFWLVIAGLLIIFFCLVSVFVPNIKSLVTSPQEFSGLGVNMRVSILTVFVLMGFVLSLSSFALQWRGFTSRVSAYEETVRKLQSEKEQLKSEKAQAQERELQSRRVNMSIKLKPKGLNEVLNLRDWECSYFPTVNGKPAETPQTARMDRADAGKALKIWLDDVNQQTHVYRLILKKRENGKVKVWLVENFHPLSEGSFEAEFDEEEPSDAS